MHGYGYDVLGRPVADSVQTLGTGVDGTVKLHTTSYDSQGNVYQMTAYGTKDGGAVLNQVRDVYNGLGQLAGEYQSQSGAVTSSTPEVQYGYSDPSTGSRMTTLIYPNGRILHYGYDGNALDNAIGRVSYQADDNGSGSVGAHIVDYAYMGAGTVVKQADGNGVALSYLQQPGDTQAITSGSQYAGDNVTGLDRFGRVIDQNWIGSTSSPQATPVSTDRFQYGYDANSNVLYKNNLVDQNFSELYHANGSVNGYDPLNRLTSFTRGVLSNSVSGGPPDSVSFPAALAGHSQIWSLDALGNWSSSTTDGTTMSRANNSKNQIHTAGGSTLAYDANGNTLTDETGQHYTYDAWNHIVSATNAAGTPIAAYTYDAAGHRITESANVTTTDLYLSNRWQVLEERQSGVVYAQNVWGLGYVDSLIERDAHNAAVSGTGLNQRLYAQQDANENVTAVTNAAGAVADRWVYDPYGKATQLDANSWAPGGTDLGWVYLHQGGRLEAATGLYYFRNRDYSAPLGRWMEQDPELYIDGANRYRSLRNSPASSRDPKGLTASKATPLWQTADKLMNTPELVLIKDLFSVKINKDCKVVGFSLRLPIDILIPPGDDTRMILPKNAVVQVVSGDGLVEVRDLENNHHMRGGTGLYLGHVDVNQILWDDQGSFVAVDFTNTIDVATDKTVESELTSGFSTPEVKSGIQALKQAVDGINSSILKIIGSKEEADKIVVTLKEDLHHIA